MRSSVIQVPRSQLYEHRDLRAIFIREDVIPVPRYLFRGVANVQILKQSA
ncbi:MULTISPECIES: hypothetical protein [unclassified Wolbachia]|nr:hypothetical protein [Wolbachia endosymbiont (group A) of Apoderus coryli]